MRDVGASRSWRRQETDAAWRFQEELPCPHLDFGPFGTSDLQNYKEEILIGPLLFPWRRKWQTTPVFLPGKSHGGEAWLSIVHGVSKNWK